MSTTPPLLVIGAGPVGLAIAKALGEVGLDYVQVEASDHVGGNWAHGVYTTAHIISSKKTTEYADFPMPAHYPDFPSASQMRAYFESYTDAFHLRDRIVFETEVTAVVPVGPAAADGWDVTTKHPVHGLQTRRYRGVLVCNGHHWSRSFPAWARDAAASGRGSKVIHSKDFHHPDELRQKRVLVVGGGNSGSDLVCEAARVATRADWSLRRGYWFMPKTFFGIPSIELIQPWLPVPAQRALVHTLLKIVVGDYARYGLPQPDHRLFEAHPTVSTEVFHYLKHGRIHPRPDVRSADPTTGRVTFSDGAVADYDLIVCATGFDVSFPFLPDGMIPVHGKVAELYAGALRPEWRHLWIVGTTQPRYGLGGLVRPGAELIAQWCRLQDELAVPLGAVVKSLGLKPPTTHLADPHAILREIAIAKRLTPLLRWRAKRLSPPTLELQPEAPLRQASTA
ncbi:MAG: NAD(P)-binding domain-containing protein [Deltaproteobacteria bacterium]|jgi:cation diffusion facilitator CzcD-associated flavoprotein CzcO|nr:NAD(P)-binding domain-containing protein [Deltaproteobacteria bacterium]